MADNWAVILADPLPAQGQAQDAIVDVLVQTQGMVRYDAIHQVRSVQGILMQGLSGPAAEQMVDSLQAKGVVAGLVDEEQTPLMSSPLPARGITFTDAGLAIQIGYGEPRIEPYGEFEFLSLCRFEEIKASSAPKKQPGKRGLFRFGAAKGRTKPARASAAARGAGAELTSWAAEMRVYVVHLYLQPSGEVVEVISNRCGFQGLENPAQNALANFRQALELLHRRAPGALVAPPLARFLDGDELADSPVHDLRDFALYNRWLRLSAMAFAGAVTSQPAPSPAATSPLPLPSPGSSAGSPASHSPKHGEGELELLEESAVVGAPSRPSPSLRPARPALRQGRPARKPSKPGWSFGGWLVRWGLITAGAFLFVSGIYHRFTFVAMDETPMKSSVQASMTRLAKGEPQFVALDASLGEERIFPTHLSRPPYTVYAPHEVQSVDPGKDLQALLGANVESSAMVNPLGVITIQVVQTDEKNNKTIKSERLIGPLLTQGLRVWVFSPSFSPGSQRGKDWVKSERFDGRLCGFDDLNANRTGLLKTSQEIRSFARQDLGIRIPTDACIILTDRSPDRTPSPDTHVWVPVKESGNAVFVYWPLQKLKEISSGTITGMLRPRRGSYYRGFTDILGRSLPERVGILSRETAADYNRSQKAMGWGMAYSGGFFLVVGLLWLGMRIALYWRWKSRMGL